MRFSVPQFIDVEDKIFGQLTFKQGVYFLGALGVAVALFIKLGFFFAIIFGSPLLFLAFLLSFVKVHGQPFINILYAAFYYALKHKLYLWKKTPLQEKKNDHVVTEQTITRPVSINISQSKLRELAWSLDAQKTFNEEHNH